MDKKDITEFVKLHCNAESHLSDLTNTLIHWCETESGSYNLEGLQNMAEILLAEVTKLAPKAQLVDVPPEIQTDGLTGERTTIPLGKALHVIVRPEAPIQILFNGHMDTVYGTENLFKTCQFIDSETLNGPAVSDMKGGLLVMLRALAILEKHPAAQNIGWEILIGADEEIGSPGTDILLKQAAARNHLGLIYESSPIDTAALVRYRMGSGAFLIRAVGKSVHVGKNFTDGRNAIEAISKVVQRVQALNTTMPQARFNTGKIAGGDALNTVPDRAYARFNIRVSNDNDAKIIKQTLQQICTKVAAECDQEIILEGNFNRPPKVPDHATTELYLQIAEVGKSLGLELPWHDTGGGADGSNLLAYGLPNIDNMGVVGGNLHSEDEFIHLPSLIDRIQLSACFLLNLAVKQ